MAILGTGILPSGAIGTELTAVTRRAFVPKCIVQLYKSTPLLAAMLANAQNASGGASAVTVPVQGTAMVTPQWAGYDGSFNAPQVANGLMDAEYNLKLLVTPIPFLGMEGAVQVNAAVIPLLEARMNDAGNATADTMSTALWTNAGGDTSNKTTLLGLPSFGSTSITVGNIVPGTYLWWQGKVISPGGTPAPTRALALQYIISATKANGGEMPTMGIMGPGTWADLANDFIGQEHFEVTPASGGFDSVAGGIRSGFVALVVAGVPIYMDPYATEGEFYLFNERYLALYVHEDAAFAMLPFESTLANFQIGYVGALIALLELVCTKRASVTKVTGLGYLTV